MEILTYYITAYICYVSNFDIDGNCYDHDITEFYYNSTYIILNEIGGNIKEKSIVLNLYREMGGGGYNV